MFAKSFILLLIGAVLLQPGRLLAAEATISRLRLAGDSSNAEIFITFDEVPPYSHSVNGKRIDLVLETSLANTEPLELATDDRVVKFLTQEREDRTILTFFLRYEPQKVEINRPGKNTLVVDILLGNQFTKSYPELTTKLEGLAVLKKQGEDLSNPYVASPYANNWRSFFSRYEPPLLTTAPLHYSKPPFPIIELFPDIASSDILPTEIFTLAAAEKWQEIIPLLAEQIRLATDPFTEKHLALVYGEALARADDYVNGYKQLYLLKQRYKDENVGIAAAYLLALVRAVHEGPFIADTQLQALEAYIDPRFELSPYIILSRIETALAAVRLDQAEKFLGRDDIGFSPRLATLRKMRQADLWFAERDYIKAYVGYRLLDNTTILQSHPYSLNGYCNALYHQKKYSESADCFDLLSAQVKEKDQLSKISLKKALAELHYRPAREMYVSFSRIEDTYPNTSAGLRAALKKTDIRYLSQPSWRKNSAEYYRELAENPIDRNVAEEAALKEAIVHAELGEPQKAIDLLLDFLRNFRAGRLTETAQALLIEILPRQLQALLADKKYVEAIVLAKKNREFFQKNWVDIGLLGLLARAYHELGIFTEAQQLYLFLLRTAPAGKKEHYYLPLISILYAQGKNDMVEDFATEYRYNYPDGPSLKEINLILLKSYISNEKRQEALSLVDAPLPDSVEARETQATLFFTEGRYAKALALLLPPIEAGGEVSDDARFIVAESLFQQGEFRRAETFFQEIRQQPKFFGQASYRLAEIARRDGDEGRALKLFGEIVEKGNDPLWQRLAQKELDFKKFDKKLY